MKKMMIFTIVILFVVFCTIFTMAPATMVNAAATTAIKESEEKYTQTFGYSQLKTDAQREAYVLLAKSLVNVEEKAVIPASSAIDIMELFTILEYMRFDFPETFYYTGDASTVFGYDGSMTVNWVYNYEGIKYRPANGDDITFLKEMKADFDKLTNDIVADLPETADTEYEKSLYVLQYLCGKLTYDYGNNEHRSVETAFETGKAQCEQYACAYSILMNKLGVKTWVVLSSTHAWNVTWINGECVYTDVTWADGNDAKTDYDYFNTTLEEMSKYQHHTLTSEYANALPKTCNHTSHGYKPETVKVSQITLSVPNTTMTAKGATMTVTALVSPSNATDKSVSYSSSNKNVATISSSGVITAVGEGKTTITVKSNDGGATATIEITVDFPNHVHSLEKVKKLNPTCTRDGMEAYYHCKTCGKNYTDANGKNEITDMSSLTIPATGHAEKPAVEENRKEATCTKDGSYDSVVYCKNCNTELKRTACAIPKVGHVNGNAVTENEVSATCTANGKYDSVIYCTRCNVEISRQIHEIPATGHVKKETREENRVEPTCTTDGSYDMVTRCENCGFIMEIISYTVPATGHKETYVQEEVLSLPTCTKDGRVDTVAYCTACHQEVSRTTTPVPAVGHEASDNFSDATQHWQKCENCNEEIEGSRGEHYDDNGDEVCDACSFALNCNPPIDTAGPSQPTEPTQPSNPTAPTKPTEPTVPTAPTEPVEPSEGETTAPSVNPTQPDNQSPDNDDEAGSKRTDEILKEMKKRIIIIAILVGLLGILCVVLICRKK